MKKESYVNPKNEEKTTSSKPVSRKSVNERTHELARLTKRIDPDITQADYEQAKREITGETDIGRQNAVLDADE